MLPLSLLLAASLSAAAPAALELQHARGARLFDGARIPAALVPPGSSEQAPAIPSEAPLALSELAERLAADPRALDALIEAVRRKLEEGRGWPGPGALDPADKQRLIEALRRADKSFLDSFPVMTVPQLQAFLAAYGRRKGPAPDPGQPSGVEPLDLPGGPALPAAGAYLAPIGPGLHYGDRSLRASQANFAHGRRLAELFNKLALNDPANPSYFVELGGRRVGSARGLIEALIAEGHSFVVRDMRFFANFGDLWLEDNGALRGVITPLWVRSGYRLPSGRELVMPVTHSHLELHLRGPLANADLTFYLGVDGSSQFNPVATESQPWVGGREAGRWDGAAALALVERAETARRELRLKVLKHKLPLGGYGPLGACNDVHAMITGRPVWPMIRDPRYYRDGMTIDAWSAALPVDGAGPADPGQVYDSLPAEPAALAVPRARELALELQAALGR